MAKYEIRVLGDAALRQRAAEVTDIDGSLVKLASEMLEVMYEAPGIGLAATQIGVGKRMFVYDLGDGEGGRGEGRAIINPVIVESRGEWEYDEGCLSIPGLYFEIVRPKEIHVVGLDLDGNEVSFEADELLARLFQHELDHLDGRTMMDLLDEDTRRSAMKVIRQRQIDGTWKAGMDGEGRPKKRRRGPAGLFT
jgi:peptide deformylase